jgi:hypothetical protein
VTARAEPAGLRDHDGTLVPWDEIVFLQAVARLPDDRFFWEERGSWEFQTRADRWIHVGYRWWRTRALARILRDVLPGFDPERMRFPRATRDDGARLVIWHRPGLRCPRCDTPLVERADPTQQLLLVCPVDGHEVRLGRRLAPRRDQRT